MRSHTITDIPLTHNRRCVARHAICLLLTALSLCSGCSKQPANKVTLESQLAALISPAAMSVRPVCRSAMVSSYDRTGGNSDWDVWDESRQNADGTMTLADLSGPGCVTRIWMTSVPAEKWLFFFDGEATARLSLTTAELFGGCAPFLPPLSDRVSGGYYCYIPLPYAKSLRIAVRPRDFNPSRRPYYHINYQSFPRGTDVATFPPALSNLQRQSLATVGTTWRELEASDRETAKRLAGKAHEIVIEPSSTRALVSAQGPAHLGEFCVRLNVADMPPVERSHLLRELVLRIRYNGELQPSVDVPFGDFFCNAQHARAFSSLPLSFVDGWYLCKFPIDFSECVAIEIQNRTTHEVKVSAAFELTPLALPVEPFSYLHARWQIGTNQSFPHSVLDATGTGHYVGCYLTALGSDGSWYLLEGDEVIHVDGEKDTQWHGTGLEDYFNGAWYYTGLFDLPLHGLLEKGGMQTAQYRFHIGDAIPFDERLSVAFEFGHANKSRGTMSSVAYWYQPTPTVARSTALPASRRLPPLSGVEQAAVMSSLFELERIEHFDEAKDRCEYYAQRMNAKDHRDVLRLRALTYDAYLVRGASTKAALSEFMAGNSAPQAKSQAEALAWFETAPLHSLLGTQVNGRFRLFLDNVLVAEGDNPQSLSIRGLTLKPGHHELFAEVTPTRGDAWFAMCLRTHSGDIRTDGTWERRMGSPHLDPVALQTQKGWEPVADLNGADMLPRIGFWQFAPNAFVMMQSQKQLLRPWRGWAKDQQTSTAYLRKRFTTPLK